MISMAGVGGAGAASSYYTKDNYYSEQDLSENSAWVGAGAEAAGLAGPVDLDAFTRVLEGQLPGGTSIPTGNKGDHNPGMDMTFSAPKSLSMLAYIGGDERLLAANMAAVKTTIAWAEKNLAETRIGSGSTGTREVVKTGNLLVALFQHDTSRNLDPQAHIHAVIANATMGPDGKWRALHNVQLWANNTLLGSIYHAELRANVQKLGYEIGDIGKHGSFEIAGVSREAVETFSTRRTEILAAAGNVLEYQSPAGLEAVAIRTRQAKDPVADRGAMLESWRERAAATGIDLSGVVGAALEASADRPGHNAWSQFVAGIGRIAERAALAADYVREKLGVDRIGSDELLPNGIARGTPTEVGAAHAVASAIRQLSEREAAFRNHDIVKAALDLGLSVTVDDVEQGVRRLLREQKLVGGVDARADMLTTPAALAQEERLLETAAAGRGVVTPIVADATVAGERLQAAALAQGGFSLNAGQESAGRLLLVSNDRVVNVQGVAGAGKSTALGAIAAVAREEGRNVLALVPQNKLVHDLQTSSGIDTMTAAKFIARQQWLLSPTVNPDRLALARAMFSGAVVVVDEASMLSTGQASKLVDLANRLEFDRLSFIGDKRQLGAVEAGKPYELLQRGSVETAYMTENLRARNPLLAEAAALANADRPALALDVLTPFVREASVEAPGATDREDRRGWLVETAAASWLSRDAGQREATLVITSGRALGDAANRQIQAGLIAEGSIDAAGTRLTVYEKVNLTREETRYANKYTVGNRIEIERDIAAQKIEKGEGIVSRVDAMRNIVEITRADGSIDRLQTTKLRPDPQNNNIRLSSAKPVELHARDMIRWTDNDVERGLLNAARAKVLTIDAAGVKVLTATGMEVTLPHGDRMLQNLDLGYAMNTHKIQGVTTDSVIGVMDSREALLTTARLFLVNITRPRDGIELIVDDRQRLAGMLESRPGDKTSALETINLPAPARVAGTPAQQIGTFTTIDAQPSSKPETRILVPTASLALQAPSKEQSSAVDITPSSTKAPDAEAIMPPPERQLERQIEPIIEVQVERQPDHGL